jgi:imidazole glycerol-phosphate synthase subunit HisH
VLVVVVDAGRGNLRSVQKAAETAAQAHASVQVARTSDPDLVRRADRVIVPGQDAFGDCMRALDQGLGAAIVDRIRAGAPYLGICMGLQVLFEESDEAPGVRGLGVLPGRVERLRRAPGIKVPHMGWNQLELRDGGHPCLTAAGGEGAWVYFVHSFHAVPRDASVIAATVGYGPNIITAAVRHQNVLATQFHPEKSQGAGLALLGAFLRP